MVRTQPRPALRAGARWDQEPMTSALRQADSARASTGRRRRVLAHADARPSRGRVPGPPGSAAASRIRRPAHDPAAMAAHHHVLAGPAADFSPNTLQQMTETAADLLADTPAPAVTVGQVRYHPDAIMLGVTPAETVTAIHDAARWATDQVTGAHAPDGQPARWRPHITICYSTSRQPTKPIIAALGTRLPGCDIDISALSLVIQHGPERAWDRSIVSTIRLATPAQ
jgi:hypothetical protein